MLIGLEVKSKEPENSEFSRLTSQRQSAILSYYTIIV